MSLSLPFSTDMLRALAPTRLVSYRSARFIGDTISVTLDEFAPEDQQRITDLYAMLRALYLVVTTSQEHNTSLVLALKTFTRSLDLQTFVGVMQQIGATTLPEQASPTLLRVVHDVKGGSLTALVMILQWVLLDTISQDEVSRIPFLVRDHLAIMRNCISDLDSSESKRDRADHPHHIAVIEQTWDQALYTLPKGTARVSLDSHFHGLVSASNIEFSALRRSLYNLINNAVRFTNDGNIYLSILGLPNAQADDVRFVVSNEIAGEQRRNLQKRYANDLGELFRGGFTTGGTGLGMRICGEFVAEDYGIMIDQCIEGRYVGAALHDEYFMAWLHWPAVTARAVGLHQQVSGM